MIIWNQNFSFLFIFLTLVIIILFFYYSKNFLKNKKEFELLYKQKKFKNYFFRNFFLFLSLFVLFFWFLDIKYTSKQKLKKVKWLDVVFVLDVSKSMNTIDYNWKTRLEFAKNMIKKYIQKHNYNRYSLVIFAWKAMWISPLTTDYWLFLNFLDSVDYKNFYRQWTDFTKALKLAINRFSKDNNKAKLIIFISDWWDKDEKIDVDELKKLKKDDIYFAFVWVGTKKGWKIFEWFDTFWEPVFKKYNGEEVVLKINEKNLEKLAWIFGGKYFSSLDNIEKNLDNVEKKVFELKESNKQDILRILMLISFFFFILYLIFSRWK